MFFLWLQQTRQFNIESVRLDGELIFTNDTAWWLDLTVNVNKQVDASVPDIALEPDKTVRKVQDKFRLDLNDEEALRYMQNLIDVSAAAVMAALVEQLHKIAQYWRK